MLLKWDIIFSFTGSLLIDSFGFFVDIYLGHVTSTDPDISC